jgi:ankyrin repeat protein
MKIFKFLIVLAGACLGVGAAPATLGLMHAIEKGKTEVVEDLLKAKMESLNIKQGAYGDTYLHLACFWGHYDIARNLLAHGTAITAHNHNGETPLHAAIKSPSPVVGPGPDGRLALVELLLEHGTEVNTVDAWGHTRLRQALGYGYIKIVTSLLSHVANSLVKSGDDNGATLLHLALAMNQKDIADLFLGANPAACVLVAGGDLSEIHWAAAKSDLARMKGLLDTGDKVNVKDCVGWTPLRWAVEQGNVEVIRLLLQHRASVLDSGLLVCRAVRKQRQDVIELLLSHKIDVNLKDELGVAPIHCAAELDAPAILVLLLDSGAQIDAADRFGQTALHLAVITRHFENIKILLEHKANPNVQDQGGRTAFRFAEGYSRSANDISELQRRVIQILLEHGARTDLKENGRSRSP